MVLCVAQGIKMNKVITASAVTLVIMMTACGYDNDVTEITVEAPEQCKPGNGHAYGHYKDAGIEDAGVAGVDDGCL